MTGIDVTIKKDQQADGSGQGAVANEAETFHIDGRTYQDVTVTEEEGGVTTTLHFDEMFLAGGGGSGGLAALTAPIKLLTIGHSRQAFNDYVTLVGATGSAVSTQSRRGGNATWLMMKNPAIKYDSFLDTSYSFGALAASKTLQTNTISFAAASSTVTLAFASAHGLNTSHQVMLEDVPDPLGGLSLNSKWFRVASVVDANTITFDAGAISSGAVTNGGGSFFSVWSAGDRAAQVGAEFIKGANAGSAGDHSEGTLDMIDVTGTRTFSGDAVDNMETLVGVPNIVWIDAHGNDLNSFVDKRVTIATMNAIIATVKSRWPDARIVVTDYDRRIRETGVIPNTDPFTTAASSAIFTVAHTDCDLTDADTVVHNVTQGADLPTFSSTSSAGAIVTPTITHAGSGLTDGTYNLCLIAHGTQNATAYGTVTVSGGAATAIATWNGGSGYAANPNPSDFVLTTPLVINGIDVAAKAWVIATAQVVDGDHYKITGLNVASAAGSGGGSGVQFVHDPAIGWLRTTEDGETRHGLMKDEWDTLAATYASDPKVKFVDLTSIRRAADGVNDDRATKPLMTRDGAHPTELGGHAIVTDVNAAIVSWIDNTTAAFERDPSVAGNLLQGVPWTVNGGTAGTGTTGDVPFMWQTSRSVGSAYAATCTLEDDTDFAGTKKLRFDVASAAGAISTAESMKLNQVNTHRLFTGTLNQPFRCTAGDSKVTVNHSNHGVLIGSMVTFDAQAPTTLGGNINMQGTFPVVAIINAFGYKVETGVAASASVVAGTGQSATVGYTQDATALLTETDWYQFGCFYEQSAWQYHRGIEFNLQPLTQAGAVVKTSYALDMYDPDFRWWPTEAMQGSGGLWLRSQPFKWTTDSAQFKFAINHYAEMVAGGGTGTWWLSRPFLRKMS